MDEPSREIGALAVGGVNGSEKLSGSGTGPAGEKPADRRFGLAARYMRSSRVAEAQRVYEAIVRDRPHDERARTALARLGITQERTDVIKFAMTEPSALTPAVLDSCVGALIKADEVFALKDFTMQHPQIAAKYAPQIVRRCRDLARAATTKSAVAAYYRCLLAVEPDDAASKAAIARLFQPEIEICRTLSGPVLIKVATEILHADPKNAIVARMKAQACFDDGLFEEAHATLSALDDGDLMQARTLALFLSALQRHADLEAQAKGIERVARHRGTHDALVLRAARGGLKSAAVAADHSAAAILCDAVLTIEPNDPSALKWKSIAAAHLARDIIAAIRSGDHGKVQRLMDLHGARVTEGARRAGNRFIGRAARRAVHSGRRA